MPNKKNSYIIFGSILAVAVFAVPFFIFSGNRDRTGESSEKIQAEIPKSLRIGDETIDLAWTDDNEGEDLIIQSDKKSYFGIDRSEVYFSITNANKKDQNIDLRFLFADEEASLEKIEKIDLSTSSGQEETVILNVAERNEESRDSSAESQNDRLKDFASSNYFGDEIKSGQTNYYKAEIRYPANSQGEFFIEAKGDNGAYGLLDPWYNSTGLVGYWSFDGEDMDWSATSAEVIDRSGNANNGDVSGAVASIGKVGQALSFDGSDDYVYFNTNLGSTMGAFSVSSWVYPTLAPDGSGRIIVSTYDWNSEPSLVRGWSLGYNSGSTDIIYFLGYDSSGNSFVANDTSFFADNLNKWTHVAGVFIPSQSATLYINGVEAECDSSDIFSEVANSSFNLTIGARADNHSLGPWAGSIDEVAVFNRALSASEISALYKLGNRKTQAETGTGKVKINSSNVDRLTTGLVGHWTFDGADMDWSATGAEVIDRSGQGNDGEVISMDSSNVAIGKVGQALEFERSNSEYISITDDDSLDPGSSAWSWGLWAKINNNSDVQAFIFKRFISDPNYSQYSIHLNSSKVYCLQSASGSSWSTAAVSDLPADNGWHHYLCVNNGSNATLYIDGQSAAVDNTVASSINDSTGDLRIGWGTVSYAGRYFDGLIDEVRVYNRALSTDEITELYQMGAKKVNLGD